MRNVMWKSILPILNLVLVLTLWQGAAHGLSLTLHENPYRQVMAYDTPSSGTSEVTTATGVFDQTVERPSVDPIAHADQLSNIVAGGGLTITSEGSVWTNPNYWAQSILTTYFEIDGNAPFSFEVLGSSSGSFSLARFNDSNGVYNIYSFNYIDTTLSAGHTDSGTLVPGKYQFSADSDVSGTSSRSFDFKLSVVPEPYTAILLACGLVGLALRRRLSA